MGRSIVGSGPHVRRAGDRNTVEGKLMGKINVRRTLVGVTALGAALTLAGGGLATASTGSGTGTLDGSLGSSNNSEHTEYGMNGWMETCPFEEILNFNEDGTAIPGPQSCMTFVVREGTMQLGDIEVEMEPNSMMIAGGQSLVEWDWKPEQGSIYSSPVTVPGGALGTGSAEDFGPTAITAHVEEAGTPTVDTSDLTNTTVNLPIRLKLSNPLLGDNCYIGTEDDPIDITLLADDETMFNEHPWTGDDGNSYLGVSYPNIEASDTDFAVPGATGCGPLGLFNGLVNLRAGLPSEGGNNSIWARTSYYAGPAWQIWNESLQEQ